MRRGSKLKGLAVGDIVYYKTGYHSESAIDKGRVGVIVELGQVCGVGFQSLFVMWSDTNEIAEVVENYLHKADET